MKPLAPMKLLGRCPVDYQPIPVLYHRNQAEDGSVIFTCVEYGDKHLECMKIAADRKRSTRRDI